ncbi:MAG: hypothetical protein WCP97_04350 [bacterium]
MTTANSSIETLTLHKTPSNYLPFQGQEQGEKILDIARKSPFTFFTTVAILLLLLPGPFLITWLVTFFLPFPLIRTDADKIIFTLFISQYFIMLTTAFFINWLEYYFDFTLITDRRVLDVSYVNLFSRVQSEARLGDIKEIVIDMHGFWQNVVNYGTIQMFVSNSTTSIVINDTPKPDRVAKLISEQQRVALAQDHRSQNEISKLQCSVKRTG